MAVSKREWPLCHKWGKHWNKPEVEIPPCSRSRSANFSCKGPESKHFRLSKPSYLCRQHSVLPQKHESKHRKCWPWCGSSKSLFTNPSDSRVGFEDPSSRWIGNPARVILRRRLWFEMNYPVSKQVKLPTLANPRLRDSLKRRELQGLAESIRTELRMCGQVAFPIPKIFSILPPGAIMKLPALNNF